MTLNRFRSPTADGYDACDLGDEAREYLEQQTPDDGWRPAAYIPCGAVHEAHEGVACILSREHEGAHYWIDDDRQEYRWGP